MIYFTSDLHLCHNQPFIYSPRHFQNIDEHNMTIIQNIVDTCVEPNDELYILGDLMLNNNETAMKLLASLNHIKKYIVLGNHDTQSRQILYESLPNTTVLGYGSVLKYKNYHFYLSHYPTLTSNYDDNQPLKRKVINLCGHTHTANRFDDFDKGLIYHVELDAHDNKPVSIIEILGDVITEVADRT